MITASIVTYNTAREELLKLLNSVSGSIIEKVYIADNSAENSISEIAADFTFVKYIFGHGNIGYGAAHNIAIAEAISDNSQYHLILNPDIYFKNSTIKDLYDFILTDNSVGLVMPKILYPDGELQYLCKRLPTPFELIGRRFLPVTEYIKRRNYVYEMRGSGYNKIMEVPFLSGCFMFFRTSVLEEVGGFDDRYFMYCEDLDICRRVSDAGYKKLFYPSVSVIHAHKKESFKNRKMLIAHIKSAIRYFNKYGWLFDKERRKINRLTISTK